MGRSPNNKRKNQKKHEPKTQPYDRELDLQKAGQQATDRAELKTNSVMSGGVDASITKDRSRFQAWFRMGDSAELSPLALAAIMLGICIFFVPVSIVLAMTGNPGPAVGVVALCVVLALVAAGLAYKSLSRDKSPSPTETVTTLRLETPLYPAEMGPATAIPASTGPAEAGPSQTEAGTDPAEESIDAATVFSPMPITEHLPSPRTAELNIKTENILREQPADDQDSSHAEGDPLV